MGTRNLQIVIKDGQPRIAKYCQWDGYPDCQGITALAFVSKQMDEEKFRAQVDKCRFIDEAELNSLYEDVGVNIDNGWITMDDSDRFAERYPNLQRDMGAEVFKWVQESNLNEIPMQDCMPFIRNGLSCEYAYLIDLDQRTFEAYADGGHEPPPAGDRFADEKPFEADYGEAGKEIWYAPKCVGKWSFDALPTEEEFYAAFT